MQQRPESTGCATTRTRVSRSLPIALHAFMHVFRNTPAGPGEAQDELPPAAGIALARPEPARSSRCQCCQVSRPGLQAACASKSVTPGSGRNYGLLISRLGVLQSRDGDDRALLVSSAQPYGALSTGAVLDGGASPALLPVATGITGAQTRCSCGPHCRCDGVTGCACC